MEEIPTANQPAETKPASQPSLLRQIIDEVDAWDNVQQQLLLMQLRKDEILARAKALDEKLKSNTLQLTEEEIAEIISKDRKENYEKKIRN